MHAAACVLPGLAHSTRTAFTSTRRGAIMLKDRIAGTEGNRPVVTRLADDHRADAVSLATPSGPLRPRKTAALCRPALRARPHLSAGAHTPVSGQWDVTAAHAGSAAHAGNAPCRAPLGLVSGGGRAIFCARSKAAAPGRRAEHRSLSQAAPTVRERKTRALKGFPPKRQLRHKNCNLPRCNASVAPRERGAERGGTRERGQPRGQRRGRAPGGERQRAGVARVRRQVGRIERVERRGPGARRARDRRVALPPPPPPAQS